MRKQESEKAIRALCHQWREARGYSNAAADRPSFTDFRACVRQNDPRCLQFSTSTSVEYDVELWFDEEFGQAESR